MGQLSQGYISQGRLVPDHIMLQLIGRRLQQDDCRKGYLLDGFPRTLAQAQALDEILGAHATPLSIVLELDVDPEEVVKRLAGRGRQDDRPEIVRKRLEEYAQRTAPLSEYYARQGLLRTIDGRGAPEEIFERIRAVVDLGRRIEPNWIELRWSPAFGRSVSRPAILPRNPSLDGGQK